MRELFGGPTADAAEALARRLEALRAAGGLPARLSSVGVPIDALPALAADASSSGRCGTIRASSSEAELLALYRSVL